MLRIILVISCFVIPVIGCQVPPDIKTLQDKNTEMQNKLEQADNQLVSLQSRNARLKQDIAELERVKSVLGQEKSSRVAESTLVRGTVREFVKSQIDNLKQFLLESNLLDYVGGELVERSSMDAKPLIMLDLYNVVPGRGTLTSVGGYFQEKGKISVKVLRPLDNELVVVWASSTLTVKKTGLQKLPFSVSVGVERGDVIAYYFSKPGMVGYDSGTGDSRYAKKDIQVGSMLKPSSMSGEKEKRAYSVGVYGLLTTQ